MKRGTVNDSKDSKSTMPILRNSVTELFQTKDWIQIEPQKYTKYSIHVSRQRHTLANCTNDAVTAYKEFG
jgi:hypothetical protein